MPNRLIEYCACYEALREAPLPSYEDDPVFDTLAIRRRIGKIISEAAAHYSTTEPDIDALARRIIV